MSDNPAIATYRWSSDRPEDRFPVENPATGKTITIIQGAGAPETDAAVRAAHRAFQEDWRWRTPAERAALLLRAADVLEAHADELAALVSQENGKPVSDARLHDIGFLTGIFRFFGSLVDKLPSDFYDTGGVYASTVLEPVGVVGEIVPFNWPPIHTGGKIAGPRRRRHRRHQAERAGAADRHPHRRIAQQRAPARRPARCSRSRGGCRPSAGREPARADGLVHRLHQRGRGGRAYRGRQHHAGAARARREERLHRLRRRRCRPRRP